jgi:hypothetical protein
MAASSNKPSAKTVFVVGAGASKEVKLPIGSELKKSIAKALDIRFKDGYTMNSGDAAIYDALSTTAESSEPPSRGVNPVTPYLQAGWRIRDAMPQAISIDNFIDAHKNDKRIELCGKLAIVRTILEAEAASTLFVNQQSERKLNYSQLENTWFNSFMQLLTENCTFADLPERIASVALIIFNYDRCIEHYLFHALQNYYGISFTDAAQLLQQLEIYHPYGTVGSLPWLSSENAIDFGATPDSKRLLGLASQIKTFTEGTDELSSEVSLIRSNMKAAHRLVFLGFAFHRLNVELLLPDAMPADEPSEQRVFATGLGLSTSDTESISVELATRGSLTAGNIHICKVTCFQMFGEYWRSMSFT